MRMMMGPNGVVSVIGQTELYRLRASLGLWGRGNMPAVESAKKRLARYRAADLEFEVFKLRERYESLPPGDLRNQCFDALVKLTVGKHQT